MHGLACAAGEFIRDPARLCSFPLDVPTRSESVLALLIFCPGSCILPGCQSGRLYQSGLRLCQPRERRALFPIDPRIS